MNLEKRILRWLGQESGQEDDDVVELLNDAVIKLRARGDAQWCYDLRNYEPKTGDYILTSDIHSPPVVVPLIFEREGRGCFSYNPGFGRIQVRVVAYWRRPQCPKIDDESRRKVLAAANAAATTPTKRKLKPVTGR